jgi:phospholipid N-methyltransferase
MLRLLLAAAAVLAVVSPASASAMQAQALPAERATDERAQRFLTLLQAGKASQAIDEVMSSSPLYAHKAGTKEAILGQIDAALGAYGPVTSFEKISADTLGTMVVRQYYLVQHRDMVVRWEFQLIRTGSGWRVGYFGFEDKVPTWFE